MKNEAQVFLVIIFILLVLFQRYFAPIVSGYYD